MACAIVTDAGTPNSRQPRCAPGTAALRNCSGGRAGVVTGVVEAPGQMCRVGVTTYACEMYVPSLSRFHWVVDRTVPVTWLPTTPQTPCTFAPVVTVRLTGADVDGPVRMLTLPSALRTVPIL